MKKKKKSWEKVFWSFEMNLVFFENRQQSNALAVQKKITFFGNARSKSKALI